MEHEGRSSWKKDKKMRIEKKCISLIFHEMSCCVQWSGHFQQTGKHLLLELCAVSLVLQKQQLALLPVSCHL